MNTPPASPSLTRRLKLLYSTGDLSTSIPLVLIMFFQLYFLTDIAGLRPDYAGWAIGAGRVWDAINDPLFGLISDRIRSPKGRRRVVLLYCAVPLGLAFMAMWFVPPVGQAGLAVYYALTFIVFDTLFTMIHVSYNALTPEIARDYDERSSLNGYRMVFSIGGNLFAVILATVLGWYLGNSRTLFIVLGAGLGCLTMIPPLIVYRVTHERLIPPETPQMTMRQAMRATLSNRPFVMIMGLYLFSWTTASILSAVLVYFANYYLRVPEQANYYVLTAQTSALAFIPFWVWMAQRLDKRRAFIIGTASWIVVCITVALLRPDQAGLAYLTAALSGSGIATAYFLPWAMIPDVVELDELKTGLRREGSFYAFASFFQKLGTGLAIWALGQALAFTGYITPVTGKPLPVQPPQAMLAIRWTMGLVPAVLLTIAILFAWRYSITRESHRAMRAELSSRLQSD
jgi:GPH family glycoside/pentoside/hexuronide:cation symporter